MREYYVQRASAGLIISEATSVSPSGVGYPNTPSAQAILNRGDADAVAFGKLFIANPDLVDRFRRDAHLNEPDSATFYSEGVVG